MRSSFTFSFPCKNQKNKMAETFLFYSLNLPRYGRCRWKVSLVRENCRGGVQREFRVTLSIVAATPWGW